MIHRKQSVYRCLVGLLASFIVAVNAGPITTEPVHSVAEDTFSSAVPYEFPDDYSISLEQAVVTRKEFASAALLKTITTLMDEMEVRNREMAEMTEAIKDLQVRLKRQEEAVNIPVDESAIQWSLILNRRSESMEKWPRSCSDLQQAGHTLRGFYLVRGSQRMEIIFCSFTKDREYGTVHYF